MNAMSYLISTLLDLYIMVVILRIWLQAARADFYNPFSQFVVKATQPVVRPLRRFIPAVGSIDMATVIFAYVLSVLKVFLLLYILSQGNIGFSVAFLTYGVVSLVKAAGTILFWILIIRAIMSWVSQGRSPLEYVFYQLTEPMLAPLRRIIPVMGGLDLSVLVLFIVLQFLNYLLGDFIGPMYQIL